MDKFEQIMKAGKDMSPAEAKGATEKLINICTCPTCPTYNRCAKNANEIFFCGTGRSFMCISEEKGCICPSCPVTRELGLKYTFFCTKGAEKTIRYERSLWGTKIP
jgi:hypothetical protein